MSKFNVIIIVLIVGMGALVYWTAQHSASDHNMNLDEVLEVQADDQVSGDPYSPVVLVEYLDFECPACRAYHPLVAQLGDVYQDEIAIVTRHYPLPFHQNGRTAAWAVEAAGKQDQWKEMADLVFEQQESWSGKTANIALFYPLAEQLGLDMDKFRADAVSQEIKEKVERHLSEGRAVGVNQTPTFFLQGEKLNNLRSVEDFSALIDAELVKIQSQKGGQKIHEHADIRIYINQRQLDLSQDKYQSTTEKQLHEDIHLHDSNGEMIHLHWSGVTIADFFASLGMSITSERLSLDTGEVYETGEGGRLTIWADKNSVDPETYLIEDLDRLLVSYGEESDLETQWLAVKDEACVYSELCPERGPAPTEACVGGIGSSCDGGVLSNE